MADAFKMQIQKRADDLYAVLEGDITEDSDFSAILKEKPGALTVDLAGIKRINSTGVREWINFMVELKQLSTRITFERCSVAIVQQLNMIANFAGSAHITSVYAPYICPSCDSEEAKLIDFKATPSPDLEQPVACGKCGEPMEFDDLADSYLGFRQT